MSKNIETLSAKEQFTQFALDNLETCQEILTDSAQWTAEQVPIVIQEYLNWELFYHGIWGAFGLIIILGGLIGLSFGMFKKSWSDDDRFGIALVFGIPLLIIGLPMFVLNLFEVVQILIAPRIFLIEETAKLIGQINGG